MNMIRSEHQIEMAVYAAEGVKWGAAYLADPVGQAKNAYRVALDRMERAVFHKETARRHLGHVNSYPKAVRALNVSRAMVGLNMHRRLVRMALAELATAYDDLIAIDAGMPEAVRRTR